MKRIRQDIDLNFKCCKKLPADKKLLKIFGKMSGDRLGTAPRGYAKDDKAIELLRYKQFPLKHEFTDKEICSPGFLKKVNEVFKKMRLFFNHMSEVLTTDANGAPLLERTNSNWNL
jgi:uncharacterized protein (DUF2461 family)